MKRFPSVAILFVLIALAGSSQFGCTPQNDNTASTNANMAVPEATPDTASIERELLRIENDWPRVMKERDGQAVRRVDSDDAHLLSWDGSVATKEEDAKFIESGNLASDSMEMSDLKVKVLDKDAAVVTGTITIKGGKFKTRDGSVDVSGQYRFVDTFARRNGEWKLVASASVKMLPSALALSSPTPKTSPSPSPAPTTKASPVPKAPPVKASPVTRTSPTIRTPPPAPSPSSTP